MFGRKKETIPEGPYKVGSAVGNKQLEKLLNQHYAEGYEVVTIWQDQAFGSNAGRSVVFKVRPPSG